MDLKKKINAYLNEGASKSFLDAIRSPTVRKRIENIYKNLEEEGASTSQINALVMTIWKEATEQAHEESGYRPIKK